MPFVVFEGVDGCGKSTLLNQFRQKLEETGQSVLCTREPGGTPLAEDIRGLILRRGDDEPVPRCELLLYEASRAQHVASKIRPALNDGRWVLSDRFFASTVAFQAAGRDLDIEQVHWLNQFACDGLEPDLTVLIDIPIEESRRRQGRRQQETGQDADRIESEGQSFHQLVRESYLEQASGSPRWLQLDGMNTVEELTHQLMKRVESEQWI